MCYVSFHLALYWTFRIEANSLDPPIPQQYAPLLALNRFYHFHRIRMQRIFIYTNMAGELFESLFLGEFILFLNQVQTYPANAEASEKKM